MIELHWLRPQALWLLVPWCVIIIPLIVVKMRQRLGLEAVIAAHLQPLMIQGRKPGNRLWRGAGAATFFMLLILALAGPAWQKIDMPVFHQDSGAVLLLDTSMQTRAQDTAPDRFTQLKFKAIDLVETFQGGQLGFIAYAGDAFEVNPLTRDGMTILQNLRVIAPEIMPVDGNDPVLAVRAAIAQLSAAGYQTGDIFWLTSGIEQRDMQELRTLLRDQNYRVNVLAVGTTEGAPVRDAQGELLRDQRGRVILPRLVPEYLQRISTETGGRFQQATADNSDIANLYAHAMSAASRSEGDIRESDQRGEVWVDAGPWIALLLLPWLLPLARRGQLWLWPICAVLLFPQGISTAVAEETDSAISTRTPSRSVAPWQRPFLTREQQAQQHFNRGNYVDAAALFQDPMRRGDALYRAGDFAAAAAAYSQSAEDDPRANFNRGNALAQLGDLDGALAAYDQALTMSPDWREAQENREIVEALRDQQQQEQQGDEQSGDEQQDSDDGQSQPSSEQDSEQHTEQDQQEQTSAEDDQQQAADEEQQQQTDVDSQEQEQDGQEFSEPEAIEVDDLTAEEREELQQMLNRLKDDPSLLLQNRLRREAQRRRQQLPPRGF